MFVQLLEKDQHKRLGAKKEKGASEIKNHHCFKFNWKRIENAIEKPPFMPDVNKSYYITN